MHICVNLVVIDQIHNKLSCKQAKFLWMLSQNGQTDLEDQS